MLKAIFEHYRPINREYLENGMVAVIAGEKEYAEVFGEIEPSDLIYALRDGIEFRYLKKVSPWVPDEHGGITRCIVLNEDGQVIYQCESVLHPKDQYFYRRGVQVTHGKAQKKLGMEIVK